MADCACGWPDAPCLGGAPICPAYLDGENPAHLVECARNPEGEFPCGPACDTEKGCVRADQLHADELHVVPVNDLVGHEDDEDCVCGPDTTFVEGGKVITHHSLDGREEREQDAE